MADEISIGIIMLLVLVIFILFVNMILSAIAADAANNKDSSRSKTCSTAAAVTAGLSVFGLILFLVLYIYNVSGDSPKGEGYYGEGEYINQHIGVREPKSYVERSEVFKPHTTLPATLPQFSPIKGDVKPPPLLKGKEEMYSPDGPDDEF
jgi:hypothetical protein